MPNEERIGHAVLAISLSESFQAWKNRDNFKKINFRIDNWETINVLTPTAFIL